MLQYRKLNKQIIITGLVLFVATYRIFLPPPPSKPPKEGLSEREDIEI